MFGMPYFAVFIILFIIDYLQYDTITVKLYTFLASLAEPNRIKHEFAESELFQYFDVFMIALFDRCFFMMYLMHLNDFYEFGSIEPNSRDHTTLKF
jgi:hypothetical protein